jgi:N-succinyldiaminopimelate aminotransferase
MPDFVGRILAENLSGFGVYPPNDGTPELLSAISGWIARRYGVQVADNRLMVLNGTREGLFNALHRAVPRTKARASLRRCWCRTRSTRSMPWPP